jgi:hypothetical protein
MNKVFHFDAPREKYHCDASAVHWNCMKASHGT